MIEIKASHLSNNSFHTDSKGKRLTRSVGLLCYRKGPGDMTGGTNPRYANGNLRRKHRARFKAMQARCGICGGEIHYDEPSDAQHPLSFVIDEIIPVSKYWLGGYGSREECARDWHNLQAAHFCCNQAKGAKVGTMVKAIPKANKSDGDW